MAGKLIKIISAIILSVFFSSCNSYYFAFDGETGYSDVALGGDRIEVTYVAPDKFNITQAKQYAIFRAAEIAVSKGFSHIKIISTSERIRKKQNATEATKSITERKDSLGNRSVEYKETPSYVTNISQAEVTMTFELTQENTGNAIAVSDVKKQLDELLGKK
ncbi:MAG: hypothetical protein JNL74_07365 [Fibrobacteres bacterium]|nr:hypothetical protein [Fibrobacterota bacterium]